MNLQDHRIGILRSRTKRVDARMTPVKRILPYVNLMQTEKSEQWIDLEITYQDKLQLRILNAPNGCSNL